jgi:hypothetical protein
MTPRLGARIQTRLLVAGLLGLLWALPITPILPRPVWGGHRIGLAGMYRMSLAGVAVVTIVGLVWELVYHGLQQLRHDRDWPSLFALLAAVPEGITTWVALHAVGVVPGPLAPGSPFFGPYAAFFVSAWLVVWLFLQGPIRVVVPRWRYNGGRLF